MLEWVKVGTNDFRLALNEVSHVLNLTRDRESPSPDSWVIKSFTGNYKIYAPNEEFAKVFALTAFAANLSQLAGDVIKMYTSTDLYKRAIELDGKSNESKSTD